MHNITLRPAQKNDAPLLVQFIKELAEYEKLSHEVFVDATTLGQSLFGKNPHAFALLAEVDGKPAGFCIYFYNFSTFLGCPGLYIEDVFVRPEFRGAGIGKQFFAKLFAIAKANNCGRVEWWVLDWNEPAIDFYKKMGAEAMSEWTVYRLTKDKFTALLEAA